jgi:hypothetical protein
MALAHAFLGRRARAMECFDQALALDPNYEPALVNKSMVTHMEEGQPLEPAVIGKTRYDFDYRGKNGRRSYIVVGSWPRWGRRGQINRSSKY